jgi:hypothetical protein
MKSSLLLTFQFFLITALFAQSESQLSKDSDTSFWYQYKNEYASRFKLGLTEKDTADYSFRFWSPGLVIKVTGSEDKPSGEIVRFVEGYPNEKSKNVFTKRYSISPTQAFQVLRLIDSLQIEVLPSDKNINGWKHGFDGIEYFTEYKKNEQYSFKNYWTPTAQDTLREAMQFQSFVLGLDRILNLKDNSKEFQNEIPFARWTNPGSGTNVMRIKPKSRKKSGG